MSAQCTMRCLGEGKYIVMIIEMIFIMGGRMGGNWNIDLPISANESEEPGQKKNHKRHSINPNRVGLLDLASRLPKNNVKKTIFFLFSESL